jgi:cytoskeleton protein RodZ
MPEIGARLREARMRAKIDINEVELRTKIRAKYLRAIENEEWDLLPGEVYAKSFLRTYATFLGLDPRQLLDDFKREYEEPGEHEVRPIVPLGRERERERGRRRPSIPPWLPIGAVLVAVVVALYFVGRNANGSKSSTTTSSQAARHHHHRAGANPRPTTPVAAAPSKVTLRLVPTSQVYICLVTGTGKRLIPGVIYSPGQTIPVKSAGKLLLTLGNNGVQMNVNGATIPVAASSGAIGYELLPSTHRLLPPAAQPRCA